jgi:hypothetical protein
MYLQLKLLITALKTTVSLNLLLFRHLVGLKGGGGGLMVGLHALP